MKIQAQSFISAAQEYGFDVLVRGSIITLSKRFTPNDKSAFADCDMTYSIVFGHVPARGGSEWGTDGGSVGGAIGLQKGEFVMNKSGVNKTFLKALQKEYAR